MGSPEPEMKAGKQMKELAEANRTLTEHRHEHKFPTEAEHRAAHRRERRAAVRQAGKRAARGVVKSEWLTRSPGEVIVPRGFKQPGRRFGPVGRRMGGSVPE